MDSEPTLTSAYMLAITHKKTWTQFKLLVNFASNANKMLMTLADFF